MVKPPERNRELHHSITKFPAPTGAALHFTQDERAQRHIATLLLRQLAKERPVLSGATILAARLARTAALGCHLDLEVAAHRDG
jgi:hypothetical protein